MGANKDDIKDQLDNLIGEYKTQLENNLQDNNNNKLNLNDGNGGYILLQDANGNDLTLTGGDDDSKGNITINETIYTNIGNVTDGNINELIKNYNKVVISYTNIGTTYDVVLQNQNTLSNIINTEQDRLEEKKELVDTSIFEQKRAQSLNESYRQKYNYYIYIIVAVISLFVSFIVIGEVSKTITFIPSIIYNLLYIASISVVGFFIYFTMLDIARRDHMDFSKINVNPPKKLSADELEKQRDSNYGGVDMMPKFCVGSDCCNPDDDTSPTTWDVATGKCVIPPTDNMSADGFKMQYDHSYTPIKMKNENVNSKQYKSFNTIDNYEYV
jgi:hypothetical protein